MQFPEVVMPQCQVHKILKGQRALVTGANSGIGKGIAIALAQAGADVAVNYVTRSEAAAQVVAELISCGVNAHAFQADVGQEDEVEKMFNAVAERFGRLDILINNAGIQKDAPFDEMTLKDWQLVLDVNLTGQLLARPEKSYASVRFMK